MYNEIDHDLQPLDLPNIMYACAKGKRVAKTITTHPFLRPLLIKLAKAKPNWKLFGTQVILKHDDTAWAAKFIVYDGNTELGHISKDHSYAHSCDVFSIDNQRMAARRMRGYSTTTKDMNKAFKIILKEFRGKNVAELTGEAISSCNDVIHNVVRERNIVLGATYHALKESCLRFAEANWEKFEAFVKETQPEQQIHTDKYHELKHEMEEAAKLDRAKESGQGMVVVLRDSEYIVYEGDNIRVLTNDELTPHMKRTIGMLKLATKGTFIPDMGVKAGDKIMYVMPEVVK